MLRLKMIIADDEPIICEGLRTMVDWASIGVEVVGVADNGAAAFELALKKQPDLILSDISMPHFSGLQMIETLRRNELDAEVIFISAYNRFDYAKEALRYGAFDYILKPIQESLLLETVRRCAEKIRSGRALTQATGMTAPDYGAALAELLRNGQAAQEHVTLLLKGCGGFAGRDTHAMGVGLWGDAPDTLLVGAKGGEAANCHGVTLRMQENLTLRLLLGPGDICAETLKNFERRKNSAANQQRHCWLAALPPEMCVTVSEAIPLECVPERLFSQICFGRITALVKGLARVAFADHERYAADAFANFEPGHAALLELVKASGRKEIESTLYRFFLIMLQNGMMYDIALVRLQCIDLINRILHAPSMHHLQTYFGDQLKTLTAQKSIANCGTLEEVFIATKNLLANFSRCMEEAHKKSTSRLANLAIQYIEEHFGSDISLSQTAQALYVSPSYLSKVFSTEIQMTFSHYLQTCRIEAAKKLLRSTNQKIYAIARQAGYRDVVHFSKSFKQLTGLSPNQYRNQ